MGFWICAWSDTSILIAERIESIADQDCGIPGETFFYTVRSGKLIMGLALEKNWVSEPEFDVELKEYLLLGYLKRVEVKFEQLRLYPYLDDIRIHLEDLYALKDEQLVWERILSSDLIGLDIDNWSLKYLKPRLKEEDILEVINDIIDMAIPEMEKAWEKGQELKEDLLDSINITPVGLIPLNTNEGYILIRSWAETKVYAFNMHLFLEENDDDQYRSLITKYLHTFVNTPSNTPERIKAQLVRANPGLPNPATFLFRTESNIPHIESLMPLAKQLAYNYIMSPLY